MNDIDTRFLPSSLKKKHEIMTILLILPNSDVLKYVIPPLVYKWQSCVCIVAFYFEHLSPICRLQAANHRGISFQYQRPQ